MKHVVKYLDQFSTRYKILQFCWQLHFEICWCAI